DAIARGLDDAADGAGEIGAVSGGADLVGDDLHLAAGGGTEDGVGEVPAVDAIEPLGADDIGAGVGGLGGALPGELGGAVVAERVRGVELRVRLPLLAVEDKVGAHHGNGRAAR